MNEDIVNILVGRKKIEWIAYNHKLSEHAKMQMVRRGAKDTDIPKMILNSPLSWKLPDNYIAIALNLFDYIIVANELGSSFATIITFLNLEDEKYSVIDKMMIAYQDLFRERKKR